MLSDRGFCRNCLAKHTSRVEATTKVRKMKVHPVAELFPMMGDVELRELADDIKKNGLQQAIIVDGDTLIDGRNRLAACNLVGIEPRMKQFTGTSAASFIVGANLHRRHLNVSQRALLAVELLPYLEEEAKKRQATSSPGTHGGKPLVANLPQGVKRAARARDQAATAVGVSPRTIQDAKLVRDESPELFEAVRSGEMTINAAKNIIKPHVSYNSGNNEWYTPKEILDAAREVFGEIDLDPASSELANEKVGAKKFFSVDDDGLSQDWSGRVWLNPPYASDLVGKFCEKLASSVESGAVIAIVLVNNATETQWFARLASVASHICFPTSRIRFWSPDKPSATPLQGQAILCCGEDGDSFVESFSKFGIVVKVIR